MSHLTVLVRIASFFGRRRANGEPSAAPSDFSPAIERSLQGQYWNCTLPRNDAGRCISAKILVFPAKRPQCRARGVAHVLATCSSAVYARQSLRSTVLQASTPRRALGPRLQSHGQEPRDHRIDLIGHLDRVEVASQKRLGRHEMGAEPLQPFQVASYLDDGDVG